MNFTEAKKKVIIRKSLGIFIALMALISTAISLLKMVYFRLDNGTVLSHAIAHPFQQFVNEIYIHTLYLKWFWIKSPTPNQMNLLDSQNLYFITIYVLLFIGFAFLSSGRRLSIELANINKSIENQMIEESIRGNYARSREQVEQSTQIPSLSVFSQFHQYYLAPLITAVIGAIIIKLIGL